MTTKFVDFDRLNEIKSVLQKFIDTSLHFYNMQDFYKGVRSEPIHPIMEKLRGCGIVEVVQAPKLISECINHYNLDTRQIVLPDDIVLISIDRKTMVNWL